MQLTQDSKAWLTLIFLSLIWGTSFILIKKALIVFAPIEVAILRISISAIAFTPFFIYFFRKLEWHRWPLYLIIGLTGSGIPAVLFATAQTQLSSGTVGVLNSMTPIFALIIGVIAFKNQTSKWQVLGIALGFVGAASLILLGEGGHGGGTNELLYGSLIIIGAILYGANVNMIQALFKDVSSMQLSTFSFFILGAPLLFIIPFTDIPNKIITHPRGWECLGYLSILAVASTVFALIIFYRLVKDTSAVFASSVAYIIPIVALIWGWFDGEILGWTHLLGMGLIIFGVYLSRKK